MVFKIENRIAGPRPLTQSVLQITEMLGLYQAELARILHLQCSDIGRLSSGKSVLEEHSDSRQQATLFLDFYQWLYIHFDGDSVAMCNWLRRENKELGGVPLLLMVDELRINDVSNYLKQLV